MRKGLTYFLTGMMALAILAGTSARSEAAMIAAICNDVNCNGSNDIIVTDGGSGDGALAITGEIIISNGATGIAYNGWEIYTYSSLSKPALGSTTAPQLDVQYSL